MAAAEFDLRPQFSLPGALGAGDGRVVALLFLALQLGEAAKVAPIGKLSVVLVALFGVTFLGERLSFANWLGVAFMALGAILVAFKF